MAGDQREPTKERLQNKLTDSDGVKDELDLFHIQVSANNSPDAHMDQLAQEVLDTNQAVSVDKGIETFVGLAAPDSLRKSSSLADMDLAPQDIKDAIQLTTVGVWMQLMGPVLFAAIAEQHPDRKTTWFDETKVGQTLEWFDITRPALLQPLIDKYKIALSPAMKNVLALLSADNATMPLFVQEYIKSEYAPTIAVMKTSLEHLTRAYTEELNWWGAMNVSEESYPRSKDNKMDVVWQPPLVPVDLSTPSDNTSVSADDDIPVLIDGSQTTDPVLPSSVEIPVIISSDDSQQWQRGSSSETWAWWIPLRKDLKGAAAKRTTASDLWWSWSWRWYGTWPLQYTQSGPDQFGKASWWEDAAVYAASVWAIVGWLAISAWIRRKLLWTTPATVNTAPTTTPPTTPPTTTTPWNTQTQGFFRRRWPWLATAAWLWGAGLYYFTKWKKPAASSTWNPAPLPAQDWETSGAEHTHDHSDHNHDDTHTHTHDESAASADEGSDIPVARPTVEWQTTWTTWTASTESSTDDRGEDLSSELAENTSELDVSFLESKHASVTDIYKKLSLQHWYKTDQQALIVDTIEQKMYVVKDSKIQKEYDISTAYNIADDGTVKPNAPQWISSVVWSNGMPAGVLEITGSRWKNAEKDKVLVAAGKNKDWNPIHKVTTEVADPSKSNQITSRILYLGGKEESTKTVRSRWIYIHGTNQENLIGQPASNGCIRMKNDDIIELSAQITWPILVGITNPTDYGYVLTADKGDWKRWYKKE